VSTLDEIKEMNGNQLSGFAECYSPDTKEARKWLEAIRDDVVEAIEDRSIVYGPQWSDDDGVARRIADDSVPIYTHPKWTIFTDLGAYNEDADDSPSGEWPSSLDDAAGIALYMIAERLVSALVHDMDGSNR
jgi:hypothetical protein